MPSTPVPTPMPPVFKPSLPPGRFVSDALWLALTLFSESNIPSEWLPIASVILNRKASPQYPTDLYQLVRQPYQFSAFNSYQHLTDESELFTDLAADLKFSVSTCPQVAACAQLVLALPRACSILPTTTLNYWSPRSMVPAGSLPRWDFRNLHCYLYPGIPAWRFVFAMTTINTKLTPTHNEEEFHFGSGTP